jgi:uncharacterized protein
MKSRHVEGPGGVSVWVVVLDPGEEVKTTLIGFAHAQDLQAASFVALGAFERVRVGYFDWEKKEYLPIPIDRQVEVITLVGDIVRNEQGEPDLHAHVALGLPDGSMRGGHLLEGHVRPTLEVTLTETPLHLVRRKRADLGIALIDSAE